MPYVTNLPFEGRMKITQVAGGGFSHKNVLALDIVGLDNKNVYSICNGKVLNCSYEKGGFGNYVRILGDDGNRYYYAHLSKFNVSAGQRVNRATVIGVEGSTGYSTGSHLHLEIRKGSTGFTQISVPNYTGLPNVLGTYDSVNYRIQQNVVADTRVFKTATTTLQLLRSPAGARIRNIRQGERVQVLQDNCGSVAGYIRSKVQCADGTVGYCAKAFLR